MPYADSYKTIRVAVRNGAADALQAAATLVATESNRQAEGFGLPDLANAKTENLQVQVVGEYLLVLLEFQNSNEESHWAWMSQSGAVTNLENEFVPPPVNAVSGTRSHGATWRYYPEMPLILREHFGV